jgi:hypothetical protein
MTKRFTLLAVLLACTSVPAFAQEYQPGPPVPMSALAPADEYFGRYGLSVLGIANTLHDADARLQSGATPASILNGPLAFAGDAIAAWQHKYPADPWIAKDLLALERVYLHAPGGAQRARETAAWLGRDYPATEYAMLGREELADAVSTGISDPNAAWSRYAALRAPLAPSASPH